MSARGGKRGGGPIVSGGGTAPAPTLSGLNRDTASSAGGASITATGTNLNTATFTVGGTSATVTAQTSTTATFTVPAKTAGSNYDVVATTTGGSATLSGALQILPAPTTTFASADFEDGTVGTGWVTSGGGVTVSTDYAYQGTKCCKMSSVAGTVSTDEDCLKMAYGNNPARNEANGLYVRYYLLLPQSTIDNVDNAGTSGQIKLHLYRDFAAGADPATKHGVVLGVGPQFRGNQLAAFIDWNNVAMSGVQVDGVTTFTGGNTGLVFVADTWNEIQLWQYNDGTNGFAKLWVNGKQLISATLGTGQQAANLVGGTSGGAPTTSPYSTKIGTCYTENSDGPLLVYVDNAVSANGYIDP